MWQDRATLLDMLRACRLILDFIGDMAQAEFLSDQKTQSAVLHQLLVLGEAAKRLSGEFRSSHQDIPWNKIAGMRDRLIHAYDEVDLDEVWRTVVSDIPGLVAFLGTLAPREGDA